MKRAAPFRAALSSALFFVLLLACSPLRQTGAPAPAPRTVEDEVRARLARYGALAARYEAHAFQSFWNAARARELLAAIRESEADGLEPEDYHRAALESRLGETGSPSSPAGIAELDLLLSDALVRLAHHLYAGKVDPVELNPNWNVARGADRADPERAIRRILEGGEVATQLDALRPELPLYRALRSALAQHRAIAAAGGWQAVSAGPRLERGSEGPRVIELRRRLAASGDLERASADSPFFDAGLEHAVRRFQARHRLERDGRVGDETLAALDVPVRERIEQIRINLERARWVPRVTPREFVVIDVAGFEAYYQRDEQVEWRSRVQVGQPYRSTPSFQAQIENLVLNPTWTVPPVILKEDILPELRRDPGYLGTRNMRLLDRDGRELDPLAIDWSQVSEELPYRIRQDPGPHNALGRVKFVFPNPHYVYLHDTPSQALFEREERTFSSGCIRAENALDLALLLLQSSQSWDRERLDAALASGSTLTLALQRPVPIFLFYWTVAVDPDGSVHFKRDPYGRDAPLLAALRKPLE